MSDTPRTDGLLTEILDAFGFVHQGNCPQRWVNHSRELERELNEANYRIKRLEEALTSIGEYWNRHNNERAMEEACWYAVYTAADALEAKEAKP